MDGKETEKNVEKKDKESSEATQIKEKGETTGEERDKERMEGLKKKKNEY